MNRQTRRGACILDVYNAGQRLRCRPRLDNGTSATPDQRLQREQDSRERARPASAQPNGSCWGEVTISRHVSTSTVRDAIAATAKCFGAMFLAMTSPGLRFALKALITGLRPVLALQAVAFIALHAVPLAAQRPYANTHLGRPLRVEDAIPESAGEIEVRFPGLRLDDPDVGTGQWRLDPAVSLAVSSRTSLEVGASFAWLDRSISPHAGSVWHRSQPVASGREGSVTRSGDWRCTRRLSASRSLGSGGVWTQVRAVATRRCAILASTLTVRWANTESTLSTQGRRAKRSSLLIKLGLTCDGSSPPVLPGGPCASVAAPASVAAALVSSHCTRADAAFALDTTIVVVPVIRARSGIRWFSGLAADYDVANWSTLLMADVSVSRLVGCSRLPTGAWS